jgi:hypothetical protein
MGRTSAMVSVHVMIEHLCIDGHGVFSEESRRIAACSVFFFTWPWMSICMCLGNLPRDRTCVCTLRNVFLIAFWYLQLIDQWLERCLRQES